MDWRAIYCEPQRELFARDRLVEHGVEVFCPFERVVRRRAVAGRPGQHRTYKIDVAVYQPYLFARTDEFLLVDKMPGVLSIVGVCGKPLSVPVDIIDRLKAVSDAKGLVETDVSLPSFWFQGKVGDQFEFSRLSPLYGLVGKIASVAKLDEGEIRVIVKMLGVEREVDVPFPTIGNVLRNEVGLLAA